MGGAKGPKGWRRGRWLGGRWLYAASVWLDHPVVYFLVNYDGDVPLTYDYAMTTIAPQENMVSRRGSRARILPDVNRDPEATASLRRGSNVTMNDIWTCSSVVLALTARNLPLAQPWTVRTRRGPSTACPACHRMRIRRAARKQDTSESEVTFAIRCNHLHAYALLCNFVFADGG